MLFIQKEYVRRAVSANSLEELYPLLQKAIELEHATIPPYLTAMFSLKPNTNEQQRKIIRSIVLEEMLHMAINCNLLNAINGNPNLNTSDFVPTYPGPLPMGIGDDLIVELVAYSQELIQNKFMKIEEPEHPLILKTALAALGEPSQFHTIGEFYKAIQQKISAIAPERLPGNPDKQVTSLFFSDHLLFPIITKADAIKAIHVIVEQGEGTTTTPVDEQGEIAHYYRFEELSRGRELVADITAPYGYSFTGPTIAFNEDDVYPLFPNTKLAQLPQDSEERRLLMNFISSYNSLIIGLHRTFNGEPTHFNNTVGLMYDLKLYAEKLCAIPFPGKPGYTIGPSFEFIED